jgi:hypothetical protein
LATAFFFGVLEVDVAPAFLAVCVRAVLLRGDVRLVAFVAVPDDDDR